MEKEILGVPAGQSVRIKEARRCECLHCGGTGYRGRIGVYEIMEVTPQLKRVIAHNEDADKIKNVALENGMKTLRMRAAEYVIDGTTSVTEMLKVSFDS